MTSIGVKMSKKFEELQEVSKSIEETKDCAVKAVAAVTGLAYLVVHSAMCRHGRRPKSCTPNRITYEVLKHLGFKNKDVTRYYKSKTVRTLEREMKHRRGTYLVWTKGHILAVVKGKVCDWTEGRLHRVIRIERVWRLRGTKR